jgi:mutual gliding-motility protein MglA
MVQFRPQSREIIAKIVYYGPPLGGKTTNLRTLYSGYPTNTRGELVVVPTGGDRTIFFDFLPIYAGELRGMQLRVQLYTVPGQVHYNSTRQVVLRGVDGVVFVADSQREMLRNNRESWENLKDNLLLQGIALSDMPHVLQYNKRDLQDVVDIGDIDQFLNEFNAPFYEAVATTGIGVEETLQGVVKLVVRSLRDRFRVPADSPPLRREAAPPPRPIVPPPVSPAEAVTKPLRQPAPAAAPDAKVFSFSSPVVAPAPVPAPPPAPPLKAPPAAPVAAAPVMQAPFDEPPGAALGDAFSFAPPPELPPVWPTPAGFGDLDPVPPAPPPAVEMPTVPETIQGPAAALTEPDAASLIARVFGRPLDQPVVSPVVLAASAARSELPPIDLPVAPPEPSRSPFDSGPAEFEPSPAFDTIEPLPAELESPVEFAAARLLPEPAGLEPPLAVVPPAAEPVAPVLEPEPAEQAAAAAPEPGPERWAVQEPMRITELPVPSAEIEPEFTAPEIPAFGEAATAFPEPEMSPFSEPPIPAFADLGDPFLLADAVFEPPAAAAASGEAADVFAAGPAMQAEPVAEASVAAEPDAAAVAPAPVQDADEVRAAPEPMLAAPYAFAEPPAWSDAAVAVVEPPAEPAFFAAPTVEVAATASAPEPQPAGDQPSPEAVAEAERAAGAAIQRVIPRALAQYGEVRELELEVPVPSVWVGGKRMTLQLRLTLVPQEEEPGG